MQVAMAFSRELIARSGIAAAECEQFPQPLYLPLPAEAGESRPAGEELLHDGQLEFALLGDEPVKPAQQRIHVAQRRRDGTLRFEIGRPSDENSVQDRLCDERQIIAILTIVEARAGQRAP